MKEMIVGGLTQVERGYAVNFHDRILRVPPRLHFVRRPVATWELENAKYVEGVDWVRGQHVDDAVGEALLAAHMLVRSAA